MLPDSAERAAHHRYRHCSVRQVACGAAAPGAAPGDASAALLVLEPLAEIASEVRHPILKRTMRELLQALPRGGGEVKKVTGGWPIQAHQSLE